MMPSLPLLMFTNNVGAILEQEARAAGIAAVISKSGPAELIVNAKALLSGVKGQASDRKRCQGDGSDDGRTRNIRDSNIPTRTENSCTRFATCGAL
jgi:hypothetical protein